MCHLCGTTIRAIAPAAPATAPLEQETCVILPRLKLAFDAGRCPQRSVYASTVLLTHGHLDHAGGLPCHAASR